MHVVIPLNKKVIVEPESREKTSKGGIIIPEVVNQKAPTKGTIIAISDDAKLAGFSEGIKIHEAKIVPGDIVLFSKYAGVEITLKGRKVDEKDRLLLIIDEDKILAKLEHREEKNAGS